MIKYLRFIAIFLISGSCSSTTDELANYFEPAQVKELNRLTEFVVSEITADCTGNQTDCLERYFNRFKDYDFDFELTGISKVKQSELLNSLSESTYRDIWSTCERRKSLARDSIVNIESVCLNIDGKFANFFTSYCSNLKRLTDYGHAFQEAGDYSPAMNGQLLKHPTTFDMNSKAELLLMSVHLLTLNTESKIVEPVLN